VPQGALLRNWTRRGPLAWALWPLSLIFRALVALRRQLYQGGWLHSARVDAMVIVVGNVVAGGAGKTPTVIALVRHLQAQGLQVGVISRGYGRSSQECLEVPPDARPQDVGDEPLLVQRATGAPVFVARTRHAAASALLARHPQTQILVCDDGLQHYALYRDLEICVFDDRGTGNGFVLPAGPLREPWPRPPLQRVGQADSRLLVLHTGQHPAFAGHTAQRTLATHAVRRDGSTVPWSALQTADTLPLLALAGIAQPESFFTMLRAGGLTLAHTLALPDHYDFDSFSRNAHEGYQLICTEKDAMKLWQHVPDALAVPLVQTMDAAFFAAVDSAVAAHRAAKLSSPHGHTTS
jgi:tetraacyldisaccharide 4'-kinase